VSAESREEREEREERERVCVMVKLKNNYRNRLRTRFKNKLSMV